MIIDMTQPKPEEETFPLFCNKCKEFSHIPMTGKSGYIDCSHCKERMAMVHYYVEGVGAWQV